MSSEQVTRDALRNALLNETGWSDHALQAELYRELFGRHAFEREFAALRTAQQVVATD
jgi:hypothetical protein